MASIACTVSGLKHYNGGWVPSDSGWNTADNTSSGYGGGSAYTAVYKFSIPSLSSGAVGTATLTFNLPWIVGGYASSFSVNYYVTKTKPKSGDKSVQGTVLVSGSVSDSGGTANQWKTKSFTTGSFNASSSTFYLYLTGGSTPGEFGGHMTATCTYSLRTFTIAYNANGGSGSMANTTVTYGTDTALRTNSFTRTGYSFKGWNGYRHSDGLWYYRDASDNRAWYAKDQQASGYYLFQWSDGGNVSKTSSVHNDTITMYAVWAAKTYYVYYNKGLSTGGTLPSTQSRTYPNAVTLATNSMTKSNTTASGYTVTYNKGTATGGTTPSAQTATDTISYTANGWTTSSSATDSRSYANGASFGSSSTTNLTLYPNFTTSRTRGKVTLATNSLTKSATSNGSYTVTFNANGGSCSTASLAAARSINYTANGWTTTSGSTSRTHTNGQSLQVTAAVTLYPCFSQSGSTAAITLPTATRTGYTFKGWSTSSTATSGSTGSYTPTGNVTLYATWVKNSYTLTIKPNGGSYGGSTSDTTKSVAYQATETISVPTRTGYTFVGWAKNYSGDFDRSYIKNATYSSTDTTFANVYNNAGNGVVTHSRISDTSGGYTYTLKITTTANTASPKLGGFYYPKTSESGAEFVHVFRAKVPVGYAVWHAANAVGDNATFEWLTDNVGTGNWETYAYKLKCGTSGTFSTFGYVYLYHINDAPTFPVTWYVAVNQITKTVGSSQTFTMGAGETTLVAQWAPNKYTVSYNANGGEGAPDYTLKFHDKAVTLSTTIPTRKGYSFQGWGTSASDTTVDYAAGATYSANVTTTLYAIWKVEGMLRIGDATYTPMVYYNGAWVQAIPYMYYNGEWREGV